ncbi:hypothetical protein L512_2604, partial [Bordetella bronchiseptica MBORD624]
MVLAAVIVLPMILDSEPVPVDSDIPIRVPDRNSAFQPTVNDPQAAAPQPEQPAPQAPAGTPEAGAPQP